MNFLCGRLGCGRCHGESCEYEVLVKVVNMRICLRSSISKLGGWKQSHFALWGKLLIQYVILELMCVWVLR